MRAGATRDIVFRVNKQGIKCVFVFVFLQYVNIDEFQVKK